MMLNLFLIRHGKADWSLSGQHSGRADLSLTQNGEEEARQLGERMQEIAFCHLLTSPLRRSKQTCKLVGLDSEAIVDENLCEWDNGECEGKTSQEILANPIGWNIFRVEEGTGDAFSMRCERKLARVLQ